MYSFVELCRAAKNWLNCVGKVIQGLDCCNKNLLEGLLEFSNRPKDASMPTTMLHVTRFHQVRIVRANI